MKKLAAILSIILILSAVLSIAMLPISANDVETTVDEDKPLLENNNIYNYWTESIIESCFSSPNQTTVVPTEEGAKLVAIESDTIDPFVTINLKSYTKFVKADALKCKEYGFVVFKIKAEGTTGECELFYTSRPAAGLSEPNYYEADGTWQYMIFDLSYYDEWESERSPISVRLDWATGYEGAAEDAYMIVGEIGFFKTEEEANAYAGIVPETKPAKTEAPETDAPETEAPTAAPETKAPETEAPKGGCSAIVNCGTIAVLMAASAFVALKKKD